jgi:hypothetical protein
MYLDWSTGPLCLSALYDYRQRPQSSATAGQYQVIKNFKADTSKLNQMFTTCILLCDFDLVQREWQNQTSP